MSRRIKREDVIREIDEWIQCGSDRDDDIVISEFLLFLKGDIDSIPSADRPQGEWIPCSERLPKDLEVVNITWINHRPMTYYADIKDKPFTATAIHYKDKWWWYSPICEDLLAEYGKSECDKMDADIEVTAWMPLPKPYGERKGE